MVTLLVWAAQAGKPAAEDVVERPALSGEAAEGVATQAEEARGNRGVPPSINTLRLRNKRSLQYDGWYPMDVSNPMADDPTVGYQPPPLERVHFSNDPMPKKPMYPVRPENPPVFVVRSEPRQPEYHSVYGTENVEYFHIHPQTNTVRAFRAPSQSVGAFRFVPAPQFDSQQSSPSSKPHTEALENTSKSLEAYAHLLRGFDYLDIPAKEPGFADKSDTFPGRPAGGNGRFPDQTSYYDVTDEYDMEGAFSEIHSTTVARPSHVFPFSRGDRNPGSSKRPHIHGPRHRPDPPSRRSDIPPVREQEDKPDRPALHELLGNFPQESQIEEAPFLGSATDSAGASFVREIPPPNFRHTFRRTNIGQPSEDPRSPQRGEALERPPGKRPWFLIDTRSSDRKREPSIASYIQPETHSGDEKIHYRPFGPVSYISKAGSKTSGSHIHNPHLDDHMNSYKPTLTANSLSELLQIFRFTHVTDKPGEKDEADEPVTLIREFRYTRPTEAPPTTFPPPTEPGANRTALSTSYRYTPSPPGDSTTEAGVTKKPGKRHFDAVADTNSLDGYLFSDSEANPEYAHPQVRPNVVVVRSKDADVSKGVVKQSSRVSVSSSSIFRGSSVTPDTFEELEIIYPGPPPKGTTAASWPLYIIHQGHSKVKVFGINSAEEKGLEDSGFTDIYVFPPTEPATATTTVPAGTAPLTTAPVSTSTATSRSNSSTAIKTTLSSTSTTTSSKRTSTTLSVTRSTTTPPPTTPFPVVDDPGTIPNTDAIPTTTIPSTAPVTDYGHVPREATDEHDYHDHDEFGVPDLAFGEDYHPEGWERPSLRLPSPSVALSDLARPTPPPPTGAPDALVPTDLAVASPESSTDRLGDATEETQTTSPPSEDLSRLRHLETDRSPATKDSPDKPIPQPRMERITEVAAQT